MIPPKGYVRAIYVRCKLDRSLQKMHIDMDPPPENSYYVWRFRNCGQGLQKFIDGLKQ